ncbi:MAG: Hsp33 family molecular chaperone HslO [Acutalibacteraceae bacterium]
MGTIDLVSTAGIAEDHLPAYFAQSEQIPSPAPLACSSARAGP